MSYLIDPSSHVIFYNTAIYLYIKNIFIDIIINLPMIE
jgi:hypothetical protein